MIPFIRSHSELMAITEARDIRKGVSNNDETHSSSEDSGQRKRYIRSLKTGEVDLPVTFKTVKRKWIRKKEAISKFIDELDYNNNIQSSYELTLLSRQSENNQKDVA